MNPITDNEFLKLYSMAEEAIKQDCEGASMTVGQFYSLFQRNVFSTQNTYIYSQMLRDISIDGKTVYITFKPNHNNPIVIWKLVDYPYVGKLGRSGWDFKVYLHFTDATNCSRKNWRGIPVVAKVQSGTQTTSVSDTPVPTSETSPS